MSQRNFYLIILLIWPVGLQRFQFAWLIHLMLVRSMMMAQLQLIIQDQISEIYCFSLNYFTPMSEH